MNWEVVSTSVAMAGVVIAMLFAVHVVWNMEDQAWRDKMSTKKDGGNPEGPPVIAITKDGNPPSPPPEPKK